MLVAGASRADEPVCDQEQPTHCSVGLDKGEVAPFDGQLVTPDLAIALGQRAEHCEARIRLESERVGKLGDLELKHCQRVGAIDQAAAAEREKRLQEALDACQGRPWWESPPFVVTVTVVVTTAALVGVWYLAIETVKATAER